MSDEKVLVLLSTFNGEKYVETLIHSILANEDVDLEIFVRDDGSTDQTLRIVQSIRDSRVKIDSNNIHLGVVTSFLRLLQASRLFSCSHVAFADQDDIWMPIKLSKAIQQLNASKKLVYTSKRLVFRDQDGPKVLFPAFTPAHSIIGNLFENSHASCTMVMTSLFRNLILEKNLLTNAPTIDHTIMQYAILNRQNTFDENSFIHYRLHSKNDVGISPKFNLIRKLKSFRMYLKQFVFLVNLKFTSNEIGFKDWISLKSAEGSISERYHFIKGKQFRTKAISNLMVKMYILLIGI